MGIESGELFREIFQIYNLYDWQQNRLNTERQERVRSYSKTLRLIDGNTMTMEYRSCERE